MDLPLTTGLLDTPVYETDERSRPPVHPNLSLNQIAILAREMAMAIRDPAITLRAAGITLEQFEVFIMPNPLYKRAFEAFLLEWESALSTNKRIAIEAAAALEDTLPGLTRRMQDERNSLTSATEAAKLFAKLAGAGEQKQDGGIGRQFNIVIDLGGQTLTFKETISAEPNAETLPLSDTIRAITQGPHDPSPKA